MTWQEASAIATALGFMVTIAAIGWRAGSFLRSIDHKVDVAMVLIQRHDEMLDSSRKSRHEMHQSIHEIQTWVQVHEKRHA
tara:strand:- start:151 stop:393 length:243 start_codon:yes stop_codon:yes gene_type:complete